MSDEVLTLFRVGSTGKLFRGNLDDRFCAIIEGIGNHFNNNITSNLHSGLANSNDTYFQKK